MMSLKTPFSQRGKGACSQCQLPYTNRYKPKECPKCGYSLGGSYIPRKQPRLEVPKCSSVFLGDTLKIYSCKTSTHDNRCLVVVDSKKESVICEQQKCKESRAIMVNSDMAKNFSCVHVEAVKEVSPPLCSFSTIGDLDSYQCGDAIKQQIVQIDQSSKDLPVAVQVSPSMFCVFGRATTNTPVGYCHVQVKDNIKCFSKDCKAIVARAKQHKAKNICLHMHILISLGLINNNSLETTDASSEPTPSHFDTPSEPTPAPSSTPSEPTPGPSNTPSVPTLGHSITSSEPTLGPYTAPVTSTCGNQDEPLDSISRRSTVLLNMKRSLPYKIPLSIIQQAHALDINGWPSSLTPECMECGLCGGALSGPRQHPGQRGESLIITNLKPFEKIKVFVKVCANEQCQAMHQIFPYAIGLFNICDKVLISIEILLELRQFFRRGVPISTAIDSKLQAMVDRVQCPPSENEVNNIGRLLYNGFYCFESITERNLDDVICGICGTVGELYLGDGNEKNCCSISEIDYGDLKGSVAVPTPLEDFLSNLKQRYVECTTYTRCSNKFKVNFSTIPPILAPAMTASTQYNTEGKKKSTVLESVRNNLPGDPALLHAIIKERKVDLSNLDQMDLEVVKDVCSKCRIPTAQKSLQRMKIDLQGLYESMLTGACPCHGFTKVPGHTGGFYHVVCRHGVTVASKFLTLQESVRDAADLYMSLKHHPLVFVCDTPCGFVRHMDCREPQLSHSLWGDFSGCFEVPTIERVPLEKISVPDIVPSEYREGTRGEFPVTVENTLAHPLTGSQRRYVLGDRFHNESNPHKSPLCQYHDINLCLQSNVLKTSYQESENNRKNLLRLRSSCVQSFSTHFFYNYLMDYYQNEEIVRRQRILAAKALKEGQVLTRDSFFRFIVS